MEIGRVHWNSLMDYDGKGITFRKNVFRHIMSEPSEKDAGISGALGGASQNAAVSDTENVSDMKNTEDRQSTREEEQTTTQVIVKPDGSRVLLVAVKFAGMETTMSLKLSEPTEMENDSKTKLSDQPEENPSVSALAEENPTSE